MQCWINQLQAIGFEVNDRKCKCTMLEHSPQELDHTRKYLTMGLLDVRVVPISQCTLLGVPHLEQGFPDALRSKRNDLERIITRL